MSIKLLIAGSQSFTDYERFKVYVNKFIQGLDKKEITIIEGGAKGTDRMAREFAIENNIPYITMEADWDTHGKAAGMIRNRQMGEKATHAILFWDGESPGTRNMISICEELNVTLRIVKVKKNGS
nr:MAG TPA: Protein of unknown function (DUF2493) [Caudoviricetes sp.]